MCVQEKQPCKVLIDVTRSTYDDRQEDGGVRPIRVYLTIILYLYDTLYSGYLVQGTIRLRIIDGGHTVGVITPFVR